uniref:Uncharacterized protein n=1 Tax=Arundo donax TaxID=35708 RepID=A0A0A9GZ47_ARUDO
MPPELTMQFKQADACHLVNWNTILKMLSTCSLFLRMFFCIMATAEKTWMMT